MLGAAVVFASVGLSAAHAWSLEEAAKDYKGTEVKVIFLDRPGYRAAIKMLPEFEQKTGIKDRYTTSFPPPEEPCRHGSCSSF